MRSNLPSWEFADPAGLGAAEVVVSELVGNAVRHGGGCKALILQARDGLVRVAADDAADAPPARREPSVVGSYSPMLIETLALTWGVLDRPAGKRVWALLPPCPPPSGGTPACPPR